MANGRVSKRLREEPGESDSDRILELSDDDDPQDKVKKKVKVEESSKNTAVRDAAVRKLRSAPKGSIGIPAVRALLAKSESSSTRFTDSSKETDVGFRKTGRVATAKAGSGSRKTSNKKAKESVVRSSHSFMYSSRNYQP